MEFELLVIGVGEGAERYLPHLLAVLPKDFPLPIVVAYHFRNDEPLLQKRLTKLSLLPVQIAEDKEPLKPGNVVLAPAEYHLLVEPGILSLSTAGPLHQRRPAIDLLFDSAAFAYRNRVIGLLLSGEGKDGVDGLSAIKKAGGLTLVQHPATTKAPSMSKAALHAGAVDKAMSIPEIAQFLISLTLARVAVHPLRMVIV